MNQEILAKIAKSLEAGDHDRVGALTQEAIAARFPGKQILDEGLIAGMNVVGEKFRVHEIFLPDVLLAARAMYAGLDEVKPLLLQDEVPSLGTVVLGSVQGDLHDIGKNLVGILLKGAGFEVVDLGNDVPPEKFVAEAEVHAAGAIGMSALLTTTMPVMKKVVDLLQEKGHAGKIRIVVGGAPLSAEYAREIGADAYGYDGVNAVEQFKALLIDA